MAKKPNLLSRILRKSKKAIIFRKGYTGPTKDKNAKHK